MPTPKPGEETEDEWMGRCVPMMMDEGNSQDQAVAVCMDMWREATGNKGISGMQNRAYSVLDVKAFDDDKRIFSGIATTPTVDRVGDIIEPEGVKYTNPMPLLHQHKHDMPIGTVRFKKPTAAGIEFEAQVAKVEEPPALKERLDVAWGEIRTGLVRATSIGFRPLEYSFMDNGGIRFQEVEVYELSTVTIPANAEAVITTVKSVDAALRKEAGVPEPERPSMKAAIGAAFVQAGEQIFSRTTGDQRRDRKTAEQQAAMIRADGSYIYARDAATAEEMAARIKSEQSEIPAPLEPAASGKEVRVVRLNEPLAPEHFVVRKIIRT